MEQQIKDIIERNIDSRVEKDFIGMAEEIMSILMKYYPTGYDRDGFNNNKTYLKGDIVNIYGIFLEKAKEDFIKHNKEKKEREFNSILTNLGSYLEMINH